MIFFQLKYSLPYIFTNLTIGSSFLINRQLLLRSAYPSDKPHLPGLPIRD